MGRRSHRTTLRRPPGTNDLQPAAAQSQPAENLPLPPPGKSSAGLETPPLVHLLPMGPLYRLLNYMHRARLWHAHVQQQQTLEKMSNQDKHQQETHVRVQMSTTPDMN